MKPKGLGRLYALDPRDDDHPILSALPTAEIPKKTHHWLIWNAPLDQGYTSQCVSYAWTHWLMAAPIMQVGSVNPRQIYDLAQTLDEWEGNLYDGTSVRAGAKALIQHGLIEEYLWAWDASQVRDYVITKSSVVLGTHWYEGMSNPSLLGYAKPTGEIQGGHAYLCLGWSKIRNAFRCLNSWGNDYGSQGRFWLAFDDLQRLLEDRGEACAAIQKRIIKPI